MSRETVAAVAAADEKRMLVEFLDNQRELLLKKVEGASEEDLRARLVPSLTTLLGLVKHLAYVERGWFQEFFLGHEVEYPPGSDEDPDVDWKLDPGESSQEIVELYRAECDKSRRVVGDAELDQLSVRMLRSNGQRASLRWIMLHMVEETARHAGHADILREQLDGFTGED